MSLLWSRSWLKRSSPSRLPSRPIWAPINRGKGPRPRRLEFVSDVLERKPALKVRPRFWWLPADLIVSAAVFYGLLLGVFTSLDTGWPETVTVVINGTLYYGGQARPLRCLRRPGSARSRRSRTEAPPVGRMSRPR